MFHFLTVKPIDVVTGSKMYEQPIREVRLHENFDVE